MATDKKQSLLDLNDYLFAQLDAISNPDLEGEELETELKKTAAIVNIGQTVINNANVILKANQEARAYSLCGRQNTVIENKLLGENNLLGEKNDRP